MKKSTKDLLKKIVLEQIKTAPVVSLDSIEDSDSTDEEKETPYK